MENNKYHILIVEDDKEIRDGVEIYLKNQGYQVWKASNGKEGLEIVAQEEIHLAILDIMMPVMDGVTMLMKLREQNHEFPVIMLSAKSEEVDKIMGLNMGADDYVTKPFTPLELLARVNSHLAQIFQISDGSQWGRTGEIPCVYHRRFGTKRRNRGSDGGRRSGEADSHGIQDRTAFDQESGQSIFRR